MTTFDLLIGRDSGRAKSCRTRSRSRTREAQNGVGVGRDENSRDSTALILRFIYLHETPYRISKTV